MAYTNFFLIILQATQLFTVLQSLFDEFEKLKERKQEVTFGIICGLAICSFFFCTEVSIQYKNFIKAKKLKISLYLSMVATTSPFWVLISCFHTVCCTYCYFWLCCGFMAKNASSGILSLCWASHLPPGRFLYFAIQLQ